MGAKIMAKLNSPHKRFQNAVKHHAGDPNRAMFGKYTPMSAPVVGHGYGLGAEMAAVSLMAAMMGRRRKV